jgi:signal transduction histidine kinase
MEERKVEEKKATISMPEESGFPRPHPFPLPKNPVFSLQMKMMALFFIISLIPLSIVGLFSIATTEKLIVDLVIRQLENVAIDKSSILERWLSERKADMQVIAGTAALQSMAPDQIFPYLEQIQKHYEVYRKHTVVSKNTHRLFTVSEGRLVQEQQKVDPNSLTTGLALSDISLLPGGAESAFDISAPVFDRAGHMIGTVTGTVGTNQITYLILNVALGKTGECYLVDKDGTFLVHKEPRRILRETISGSESFQNIMGRPDPRETYLDYRGIEVFGTSLRVPGTEFRIVVEQDRDEVFESVDALKKNLYLTILFAVGSVLLFTWVIFFHMIRPIKTLSRSADLLAGGRFEALAVTGVRRDEIGVLFRAFENMALKLRDRQKELEKKVDLTEAELKETGTILKRVTHIAERAEKFAALGRLSAAVAHEIRTPLTSLKLFLESIQADIEISAEWEEDYAVAMQQIIRIEGTINRFLDFSKPREPVFSDIDPVRLVEGVIHIVRPMISRQEAFLNVAMARDLPRIRGDQKMLEEALINLFVNAMDAMPKKGRLSVSAAREALPSNGGEKSCVRIDISDTGSGIPEERIEHIFEPFFTTKSSGTGLGLPLVLNTIRHHGGDIQVKSQIDKGTVFSLFLPINHTAPMDEDNGNHLFN